MIAPPPNIPVPIVINQECLLTAALGYQIPPDLLVAIRQQEGGQVGKATKNNNGSRDLGPMQINTVHAEMFQDLGVSQAAIRDSECVNLLAGAFLLRKAINRNDGHIWAAVGEYHSRTPWRSKIYQEKIHDRLITLYARYRPYVEWLWEQARIGLPSLIKRPSSGGSVTIVRSGADPEDRDKTAGVTSVTGDS